MSEKDVRKKKRKKNEDRNIVFIGTPEHCFSAICLLVNYFYFYFLMDALYLKLWSDGFVLAVYIYTNIVCILCVVVVVVVVVCVCRAPISKYFKEVPVTHGYIS